MKEEDELMKKFGTDNPFNVPESYFDNLTEEIMGKLPEKETIPETEKEVSIWLKVRPWVYMVAMFLAILLPIRYIINSTTPDKPEKTVASVNEEQISDEYIDVILDNSMMDDYTLYQYLTEADTDASYNY